MKKKYNENIMQELHYKSGLSSALRSLIPAGTAICIFCGKDVVDAYKAKVLSNDWKEIAENAISAGETPPPHPLNIVVHTTNANSTIINTPNLGILENTK